MQKALKTSLERALDTDFHYYMECDYNSVTNCYEEGCDFDSICRCSKIEDCHITEININNIVKRFTDLVDDEFTKYCIERSVFLCKLWDPESWYINIGNGYYGQEIEDIKLDCHVSKELKNVISKILMAKTNRDKLFIVLEKEYGYILPELKNQDHFGIITVSPREINVGDLEHYKKLNKDIIKQYEGRTLAIGVGIRKDGGIRLLDGYHRFAANKELELVNIIVGEDE